MAKSTSSSYNGVPVLMNASYLPGFVEVSTNLLGMLSSQAYDREDQLIDLVNFQLSEPDESYSIDLPEDGNGVPTTLTGLTLGRTYHVEPQKNTDPSNGLSSFEIFLAQRYLLGYEVAEITDPLQVVGLDMNCSQSFTTLDLLIMQSLLVGDLEEAPGCNSWAFVPDSHVFPEDFTAANVFPAPRRAEVMLMNDSMVMFTGIKTGDLLGSADPGRSAGNLPLLVKGTEELRAGSSALLTLTMAEAHELAAFQGQLRLADGLDFIAASGQWLTDLAVGTALAERGRVALSWFSATGQSLGAAAGAELLTVAVYVNDTYVPGTAPLTFDRSAGLVPAAHGGQGERYLPEITTPESATPGFLLYPATPNPAGEYTDLRFELPASGPVDLTVLDGLGRPVIRRNQNLEAGTNRFRLDLRSLPAGTYYYRLVAGGNHGEGKVVVK